MSSYFYSGQVRRFLGQFIRILNNFQVQLGADRAGTRTLYRVPIYYGDSSRQVASILTKNSENSLPTVPAMSVYIGGLRYDRARVQEPQFVSKMRVSQNAYNDTTGAISGYQGDQLLIERLMPVPYLMTLKVDIWCSNTDQKLQLFEQISVLFNPSLEIQSTDSYVDWTSLTVVTLNDINFTSRSVPIGTEDPIDIMTYTFELPIWLSAPAKVKRQGVVQAIIASIYDSEGTIDQDGNTFDINASLFMNRSVYTPMDYNVVYLGNTLKLYYSDNQIQFNDGTLPSMRVGDWSVAIERFGEITGAPGNVNMLTNGISQVRLENDGITVVGTVAYHPSDPSLLMYTVDTDTLPVNTLTAVNAIIDPLTISNTALIANPTVGDRYLILNPIGDPINDDGVGGTVDGPSLWYRAGQPMLVADTNDIIQWNGNTWSVSFDSSTVSNVHYVTNLTTSVQYKWKNNQWSKSVQGRYGVGSWSFVP
jgi:hypothetical protein